MAYTYVKSSQEIRRQKNEIALSAFQSRFNKASRPCTRLMSSTSNDVTWVLKLYYRKYRKDAKLHLTDRKYFSNQIFYPYLNWSILISTPFYFGSNNCVKDIYSAKYTQKFKASSLQTNISKLIKMILNHFNRIKIILIDCILNWFEPSFFSCVILSFHKFWMERNFDIQ